jgi:hypothetical protein
MTVGVEKYGLTVMHKYYKKTMNEAFIHEIL